MVSPVAQVCASDPAVGSSACVDAESADVECRLQAPKVRALFLHIDTVCVGDLPKGIKTESVFVSFPKFSCTHKLIS